MYRIIGLTLFLITSGVATNALAQTARVTGIVVDAGDGAPLPGANVLIDGTLSGTITSPDGRFELDKLRTGSITLVVSAVGFASTSVTFDIEPGHVRHLTAELEPVFLSLPNIEVVGERSLAGRSTPATYNRIRSDELRLSKPLGTEEALRSVPGVHVATDDGISNRTNIGIRGVYPRRSEKILLLEDGVPIQPALYLAPSAYYNPPAERLDAIEVIKNTTNVQFGAGSLVGAVNYVTRRPPVRRSGVLSLSAGSNGYISSLLAYGGSALAGKVGGEIQLLYKSGDGFRENTAFDIYNGTAKLLFRPASGTTVSLKANLHREDAQATYAALTSYMFESDPAQNAFEHDRLETGRVAVDLNLEQTLGNNLVLLATAYANHFRRDWWRQGNAIVDASTVDTNAPEGAVVRVGLDNNRSRLRDFQVVGIAPRLVARFQSDPVSHFLEAGLRLHRDEFDNVEIDTDRPDARADDFDAASFGDPSHPSGSKRTKQRFTADAAAAFLQERMTIGRLGLTAGLRVETYRQTRTEFYDREAGELVHEYTEATFVEVLPAFGLTFATGPGVLFGGVFRGFVPLTSSFAFSSLVDDEGFELSEHLEPEHSLNLEIGYRTANGRFINGSFAAFQNTVGDLVAAGRNADFVPYITNLGRVRYRGIELDLRLEVDQIADLPFELEIDGQTTLLDSEITQGIIDEAGYPASVDVSGNEAPYAPDLVTRLGGSASIQGLQISFHFNHVSDQYADFNNTVEETPAGDNGRLPSYNFLDGSLLYRFSGLPITASVTVKNLANTVYRGSRLHRSSSGIFAGGFRQVNVGIEVDL